VDDTRYRSLDCLDDVARFIIDNEMCLEREAPIPGYKDHISKQTV
jgi:hypothetical protein